MKTEVKHPLNLLDKNVYEQYTITCKEHLKYLLPCQPINFDLPTLFKEIKIM